MAQINAYLSFNGNCREAMSFYKECLGGELIIQTVKESPMANQWPANVQEGVLHASLINGNLMLLGTDMPGAGNLVQGNMISLALMCNNEKEINAFFASLSEGGKVTHPLHKFFGGTIGALTDKFGMTWLFKL